MYKNVNDFFSEKVDHKWLYLTNIFNILSIIIYTVNVCKKSKENPSKMRIWTVSRKLNTSRRKLRPTKKREIWKHLQGWNGSIWDSLRINTLDTRKFTVFSKVQNFADWICMHWKNSRKIVNSFDSNYFTLRKKT